MTGLIDYLRWGLKSILITTAGGAMMYGSKHLPSKYRTIGFGAGALTALYGAYTFLRDAYAYETTPPIPERDYDKISVIATQPPRRTRIIPPIPPQYVKCVDFRAILISAGAKGKVWVGMSLLRPNGEWEDYSVIPVILNGENQTIDIPGVISDKWIKCINFGDWLYHGEWMVRASVWNIQPTGDCEPKGVCKRLADDWSSFIVGI